MSWKPLCSMNDIEAGSMKVIQTEGTNFLVLRSGGGAALVVPPTCPHMTAELCEGFFDGSVLTCTKHLWQWSAKDGSMMGIAEAPLLVYPSREMEGTLQVEFDGELLYGHEE